MFFVILTSIYILFSAGNSLNLLSLITFRYSEIEKTENQNCFR